MTKIRQAHVPRVGARSPQAGGSTSLAMSHGFYQVPGLSETHDHAPTLTHRQARFVDEYLVDLSATQAAIRAGYSAKTAKQQGQRLLTNVYISAAVRERIAERAARTEVTQDRVVRELAKIAFSNLEDVFDASGSLVPPGELPQDVAAALRVYEVRRSRRPGSEPAVTVRIRFHNKLWALEALLRHLGG